MILINMISGLVGKHLDFYTCLLKIFLGCFSLLYQQDPPTPTVPILFFQFQFFRRYKYLVLGHEETYFVKEHSDSKSKYSEDDIIKMLEFLVDNIFVVFAGKVFQQTVGIPMGTNCAPLLADIFLYSYEADFINLCSLRERNI